jgi:hopene-associated glycosyltransferase HpnB
MKMMLAAERLGGIVCVGIWTVLALFRGGFWRLQERLGRGTASSEARVIAVVPARDEASVIKAAVGSLRRQSEHLRVVVADDESSDGTGGTAIAAGAEVATVRPLAAGWKGKLWAVSEGLRAAGNDCDYYLLTDADIEYASPAVLNGLLARSAEGFDLVSVMARLRCDSAAEKMLIPAFVFFFFMLYPPKWVRTGRGTAAAAGGCMLIRREMLERIGGIAAIKDALIDDCALAAAVRAKGGRVWLGTADDAVLSIRGYGRAAEIRAMIARSAFAQLRHSAWILAGTVVGLVVTYLLPVLLVFSGDKVAVALGLLAWGTSAVLFAPTVRMYRAPAWTAFCLPAIAAFYLEATVESALGYWNGRGGTWKGRVQDRRDR